MLVKINEMSDLTSALEVEGPDRLVFICPTTGREVEVKWLRIVEDDPEEGKTTIMLYGSKEVQVTEEVADTGPERLRGLSLTDFEPESLEAVGLSKGFTIVEEGFRATIPMSSPERARWLEELAGGGISNV